MELNSIKPEVEAITKNAASLSTSLSSPTSIQLKINDSQKRRSSGSKELIVVKPNLKKAEFRFEPRSTNDEQKILKSFLSEGIDCEDIEFLQKAYLMFENELNLNCSQNEHEAKNNGTIIKPKWSDHAANRFQTRRELNLLYETYLDHKNLKDTSISMRTQGFTKLTSQDKTLCYLSMSKHAKSIDQNNYNTTNYKTS
jgi:hypothetical protein